jgi:hypothetical protein
MAIVSRWPVLIAVPLAPDETGDDHLLTAAGVERVFAMARSVYLAECTSLDGVTVEVGPVRTSGRPLIGFSDTVMFATGVVEIYPDSFVMNARIWAPDGEGDKVEASCTCSTGEPLPDACRDEFIARAHSAGHMA